MKEKQQVALFAVVLVAAGVYADSITHGGTTINMDFVNIGDGGALGDPLSGGANTADSTGYGSVGYNYSIGKFEVTATQWASVIATDSNVGNAGYWSGSQPTAGTSWYEAAKFCNWLTTGDAYTGAYQFNGSGTLVAVNRGSAVATYGTVYVLPTEDEWYKAAYFKSDASGYTLYATGNSLPPRTVAGENYNSSGPWGVGTGAVENNGTYDINGNVREWNESAFDGTFDDMAEAHGVRGGSYSSVGVSLPSSYRSGAGASAEINLLGFRVAAIPEPGVISLMTIFGGGLWFVRRFFRI